MHEINNEHCKIGVDIEEGSILCSDKIRERKEESDYENEMAYHRRMRERSQNRIQ
jgi:hypothetical protein